MLQAQVPATNTLREPAKRRNRYLENSLSSSASSAFAEFHSSDSSDDEVPCLFDGTLQQEYGRASKCWACCVISHMKCTCACVCFRIGVQAAATLHRVHRSDPADLSEPSGHPEVEAETVELEALQSGEGVYAHRGQTRPRSWTSTAVAGRRPWRSCCCSASLSSTRIKRTRTGDAP